MCCWTTAMSEKKDILIDYYKGTFLVREQHVERIFSDNTSVNRFVVSEAILNCLRLIEAWHGKTSKLYGYNTDTSNYESKRGKGVIYTRQAGCGKTTKLCQLVMKEENPLFLSFTNKAIENVKSKLVRMGMERRVANNVCSTFDSYFCEWKGRNVDSLENKTIFVEEFTMVPNKWMTLLYKAFTQFHEVHMFGDPNQCKPVEPACQINYDYLESKTIKNVWKGGNSPLQRHVETRQTSTRNAQRLPQTRQGIFTIQSRKRKTPQKHTLPQFDKNKRQHECIEVMFNYNNGKETYNICKVVPVLATEKVKEKGMFNTMELVVEEITDDDVENGHGKQRRTRTEDRNARKQDQDQRGRKEQILLLWQQHRRKEGQNDGKIGQSAKGRSTQKHNANKERENSNNG